MSQPIPHNPVSATTRFLRAIFERDPRVLAELAEAHPVQTLFRLDSAMRGLAFDCHPWQFESLLKEQPALREWVEWLAVQDLLLRRQLGAVQREGNLAVLRDAYRTGKLVLVVGAGAGIDVGLPGWDALAIELIDRALHQGSAAHRRELQRQFRESHGGGEFLETIGNRMLTVNEASFADHWIDALGGAASAQVRRRLQRARRVLKTGSGRRSHALRLAGETVHAFFKENFARELRLQLWGRTLHRTKLHPAIARMVRPPDADPRTPRVFAIVTYNFDDLLETAIREAGYDCNVVLSRGGEPFESAGQTAGGPRMKERPFAVDVIHVHGFLPATRGAFLFAPLDDVDLVFSEEQYRARYGPESGWTKRVQQAHFGGARCLFLGSSLEDQDAINQLADAHRRHSGWFCYAIMKVPGGATDPQQFSGIQLERLGARYRKLGVHVLWVSDLHEDIPQLLDSISGSTDAAAGDEAIGFPPLPISYVRVTTDPVVSREFGEVLARLGDEEGARAAVERAAELELDSATRAGRKPASPPAQRRG